MKPIFPQALRQGDTIALVAPASPVIRERIEHAISQFEEMGFRIRLFGDIYRSWGYLAGDDATRAEELMSAFADPEVKAVFPARGGTGVTRILDLLDYEVIHQNPKIFAGFSDNTALHLAIQNKTGLVTFHSPHPMDGIGSPKGMNQLTAETFWRAILAKEYQSESEQGYLIEIDEEADQKVSTLFPGKARGRLVGGNLALVASLMGTPYEIDTKNNILFLEDVEEQPYRIDRFLSQLQLAGKLKELKGVVLGQFTDCQPSEGKPSLTLDEIFHGYFHDLNIPVVQNFPTGHSRSNATLPLNTDVELDADRCELKILVNPVSL